MDFTITWGVFEGVNNISLGTGSWNGRLLGSLNTAISIDGVVPGDPPVKKLSNVING